MQTVGCLYVIVSWIIELRTLAGKHLDVIRVWLLTSGYPELAENSTRCQWRAAVCPGIFLDF